MKNMIAHLLLCSFLILSVSCQKPAAPVKSPVNVIFDTDLGSSTDDLIALMLLHRYSDMGKVNILGVVVDRPGEDNYAVADVMDTYYGHPDIPIGIIRGDYKEPEKYIDYAGMFAGKDKRIKTPLPRTRTDPSLLPDGYRLYRQLLAGADDKSVTILSVGFLLCLSDLIDSGPDQYSELTGYELLRRKVSHIYIMGGKFPKDKEACYNFRTFCEQSYNFLTRIPSEIFLTLSPCEAGDLVDYPTELVLGDLDKEQTNPIWMTYKYFDCDTGQRMWDALVSINAVKGDDLFDFSPWGIVNYDRKCITSFNATPDGRNRYQKAQPDPGWSTRILDEIRRMNTKTE